MAFFSTKVNRFFVKNLKGDILWEIHKDKEDKLSIKMRYSHQSCNLFFLSKKNIVFMTLIRIVIRKDCIQRPSRWYKKRTWWCNSYRDKTTVARIDENIYQIRNDKTVSINFEKGI